MVAKERDRFRFRKEQGRDERTDLKRRQTLRRADDARPNGLVEIPGPFTEQVREDIVRTARNVEEREAERRQGAKILRISAWEEGLVIETEEEKLAQMIGEAIGKSRHAEIDRFYDDEGMRRVVVCRLPDARSGA